VGTSLVDKAALNEGKYDLITEKAKRFIEAVKLARAG